MKHFISDSEIFFSRVNKDGPFPDSSKYPSLKTRCWNWTSNKDKDGYGKFNQLRTIQSFGKKRRTEIRAHRWSWNHARGEIPSGMWVLHACDNPSCVNPDHLFIGNAKDNSRDRDKKGRGILGEKAPRSKLNPLQVRVMRRLREIGMTYTDMEKIFGIANNNVRLAVLGKTWKHV